MSHFEVMVVLNTPSTVDLANQLEPFNQNTEDPEFSSFQDETDEITKEYATGRPFTHEDSEEEPLHRDTYSTVEEFAENWYGRIKTADGRYGYVGNPNAKWDWYTLGGRWMGHLISKSTTGAAYLLGRSGAGNNKPPHVRSVDLVRKRDIDMDEMEKLGHKLRPFAVIKDRKWYSSGDSGWFGVVLNAKEPEDWSQEFKSLFADVDDNQWIAWVDCHGA